MNLRDVLTDPATAKAVADFTRALWYLAAWWAWLELVEYLNPKPPP